MAGSVRPGAPARLRKAAPAQGEDETARALAGAGRFGRPQACRPEVRPQPTGFASTAFPRTEPQPRSSKLGLPERPVRLQGDRRGYILRRRLVVADAAALCLAL